MSRVRLVPARIGPHLHRQARTDIRVWCLALFVWCSSALLRGWGGIPEPGLVLYGIVSDPETGERLISGELVWAFAPQAGGASVSITTALRDLDGQFSYVLQVPLETPVAGSPVGAEAIPLTALPTSYIRSASVEAVTAATGTVSISTVSRGQAQRIDLVVLVDTDGDGLPDVWETRYFGGATNAVAGRDDDGDGLSNTSELRAGTNPRDASSVLAVGLPSAVLPSDTFAIQWLSVSGKQYVVQTTENLQQPFVAIASNIVATPPINIYTDAVPRGTEAFYRVQVE